MSVTLLGLAPVFGETISWQSAQEVWAWHFVIGLSLALSAGVDINPVPVQKV
jgi:hypothetical protein